MTYPTVGMMLCNHEDLDSKKACFDAYDRCIAARGLRSVMLPSNRAVVDQHAAAYDPFWKAAAKTGRGPQFMIRMDHAYERHRVWLPAGQELSKRPSSYFRENLAPLYGIDVAKFA